MKIGYIRVSKDEQSTSPQEDVMKREQVEKVQNQLHLVYHTPNRTPTCEPIYEIIGCNIKAWREHLGFTQRELAEVVGITRTSINNTEAGRQRLMLHTVEKVADALGIPLCDLFAQKPTCWHDAT